MKVTTIRIRLNCCFLLSFDLIESSNIKLRFEFLSYGTHARTYALTHVYKIYWRWMFFFGWNCSKFTFSQHQALDQFEWCFYSFLFTSIYFPKFFGTIGLMSYFLFHRLVGDLFLLLFFFAVRQLLGALNCHRIIFKWNCTQIIMKSNKMPTTFFSLLTAIK